MKNLTLIGALLALSVTACNKPATDDGAGAKPTETAANAAAPAPTPTPAAPNAFTKEYMIGQWADEKDGDCVLAQDFKADGSVEGAFDSWSIVDAELHAEMAGEKMVFPVTVVDQKHIDIVSPQGKKSRLVRC